jgi:GNAT superfamily N-acetyltransferase
MEKFFRGKPGKHALQIPPYILNDEKVMMLNSRGYTYSNSWVTFYRDSSPVESRGTDLEIREIGKEHAGVFAHILNEVFAFPHEFDDIAASTLGQNEWVTFMAFDGENIAGSAGICITGETAYLSFANVLPEYRRRGVQGELLKRRIDAARERGSKWIVVDTAETSDENPNPSYWNMLRHGFRLLYHRPNYVKVQ